MMSNKIYLLSLVLFACTYADWDVEYWQYLNWENTKSGAYRLYTTSEIRANKDLSQIYHYRLTENFAYQANSDLTLEFHYSLLYNRPLKTHYFTRTHRLEFELNPHMEFDNGISLDFRNRIEALKRNTEHHIQFIFRQRSMASFPIKNSGKLIALRIYNEVFYSFDTKQLNQNRLTPLELVFALNPEVNLSTFVMLRNFISSSRWHRSIVCGSTFEF